MKILVPIDESVHSKRALERAKEFAILLDGDITIINVMNPIVDLRGMHNKEFYEDFNRTTASMGKIILDNGLKVFSDFQGKVDTVSKKGDPAEEIIKYAEQGEYDLVIMGSRGGGRFARTLLGSVSDKVIHHIKTSVLIVK